MPHPYKPHKLTADQAYAMEVARVGFMSACPFFAHYFYAEMKEFATLDIPTASTDGRHVYYNPEYLASLKPPERVFVIAHEVDHAVCKHPQRFKHYTRNKLSIGGKPADWDTMNRAADYCINAGLVDNGIGMINPSWLWRQDIIGEDVFEDVYPRVHKKAPPGTGKGPGAGTGQGAGQGSGGGGPQDGQDASQGAPQAPQQGQTYGGAGKAPKGMKGDARADAQGGGFDEVLEPWVDPATGAEDLPNESEFREAIARAASAAKAVGKFPANFQRMVDEILDPQVDWKEHIRMLVTGSIGSRFEDWSRPNRRRLALNPIVVMPGRRGYGADTVCVGVDTSGSIGQKELDTFLAEVGGILSDVHPRRIVVIGCDAAVGTVEEVGTLEELAVLSKAGLGGGGGTDFRPVFDFIEREGLKPETCVYLTDMMGVFPSDAPAYPVVWAATTDIKAPFGDTVKIKLPT